MLAELVAPRMIARGLKGTLFSRREPAFPPNLDGIGWYIHMPFCRRMCPYCSFHSVHFAREKALPYVDAVKKEIALYRRKLGRIRTGDIYFGGGTPSLTWRAVIEIADSLRELFDVTGDIGMEASPEDVSDEMCGALKSAGVSRMSVGVQSFMNETLLTMRRQYDCRQALNALDGLQRHGFSVSIDLLYGLPRQRVADFLRDVEAAARTGAHQISAYPLMLFPHTRWYREVMNGTIVVPTARTERKMFYAASDFLTANGYRQASCWDFINTQGTAPLYATCTRDENIGVGLSAYSKIGGAFYVNTFSLDEYITRVDTGLPIATGMTMPAERVMRRWFMMALYYGRVEKAAFMERFGMEMEKAVGQFVFMLKLMNIIRERSDHVETTRAGMYWISLMTKASMLAFPGRYYQECMRSAWPPDFTM